MSFLPDLYWVPKIFLRTDRCSSERGKGEIVTMALRRANEGGVANILDYIPKNVTLLPNTSGAQQCGGGSSYCKIVKTDQRK